MLAIAALLGGGYLLGAIPFGVIIARSFYHTDIRRHGSKNTGATNVWRVLGWKPGASTLALDAMKGVIPVMTAKHFFPGMPLLAMGAGFASIVGHNWSVFLMGSGGKGVATSAGVFMALIPLHGLVALATFLIFFFTTKHVSIGSMAAAVALLITTLIIPTALPFVFLVVVAAGMVLYKHIPNMKRLMKGEENKVNFQ